MHDEIRDPDGNMSSVRLYSVEKAKHLYRTGKYTIRQLSIMKQENIREGTTVSQIHLVIQKHCGYCFKYFFDDCIYCPIRTKVGNKCYSLKSYEAMMRAQTIQEMLDWHKIWCKELGLWKSMKK